MSRIGTFSRLALATVVGLAVAMSASDAFAARGGSGGGASFLTGGSMHFGILGGYTNANQEHINTLITRANSRAGVGPINTGQLTAGYEGAVELAYRLPGSVIELLFRPSYFYEKSSGSGTDGGYNYGVTGFTLFPIVRFYPLENDVMKVFLQFGLGYGRSQMAIDEGPGHLQADGDAFGAQMGLGAEFCITAVQCITVEGNYRYLTMERNLATSASGSFAGGSLSQGTTNREVELDGDDLAVRMGGLQMMVGYMVHF